ncbi:hypothetical protein [Sorangium sp. So ce1024]|uniref:hypothetical protein n=1 Tax=unclassified Sorangium TaxID=2621164 RepID=UPI003F043C03
MRVAVTLAPSALAIPVLLAAAPGAARAEGGACRDDDPPIAVVVEGASPALERAIFVDLAAELARTDLCARLEPATSPGAPAAPGAGGARHARRTSAIARVTIRVAPEGVAAVRVDDEVTHKRLERTVEVAGLEDDGRALAIAIAADELLRASWVELTLKRRDAAAPEEPVPPAVRASVDELRKEPGDAGAGANEIGLRATLAAYGGGQVQLGGALFFRRDFRRDLGGDALPWLAGSVFVYGREAIPTSAALGTVLGHAAGGGASLAVYVARTARARLGVEAAAEVGYVVFEGRAEGSASASRFGGPTAFGALGVTADVDLRPVRLGASVGALAPLLMVEALEGDTVVTGMGGPGVLATMGAGVAF